MTDKQIIGGRGSAKPFTTLNSINLMLEIDDLKEALKTKEQECEELKKLSCKFKDYCTCDTEKLKQTLTEIKEIAERGFKHSQCNCGAKADLDLILQKISEVEDDI